MRLTFHDLAFGGKGVARTDGMVVFVPQAIPGETGEVTITRRKKKFAEGRLEHLEEASPQRVTPPCRYFGRCGGCAYQHIDYPAQLVYKAAQVETVIRRIGKLTEVPMRPTLPSPRPYGYRNRIRVHHHSGKTGFYGKGEELVDIAECLLAEPEVNAELARLRTRALPEGDYTLSGRPTDFFEQTNDAVAEAMVALVRETITPGGLLVDAYCGAGFFARQLHEKYEKVIGIEENPFAIAHARSLATAKEQYFIGDVADQLPAALEQSGFEGGQTSVLLDPPAAGVTPAVLETLLASRPREILYISCDPTTLARDLGTLKTAYRLLSVTPLDMFPQTAEIETFAHLAPA